MQNRAARIVTGPSFDTPGLPLIKKLGWRTIEDTIINESNVMVFKSLHELVPQYMCNLFTRSSQLDSRNLRTTVTDLGYQRKTPKMDKNIFPLGVLRAGMTFLLSASWHPP